MPNGPVVVIDDDSEDLEFIKEAFEVLKVDNPIITFKRATEVIPFFEAMEEQPILVICDISMPKLSGLKLREQLIKRQKFVSRAVPFIFLSMSSNESTVKSAHELSIQGYFVKPDSFIKWLEILRTILNHAEVLQLCT